MISTIDTISKKSDLKSLKPIIFTKYNTVYYGFNTLQTEYIYNSLIERDFYYKKFKLKVQDFNNVLSLYDKKILNMSEIILLKDSIIITKDAFINQKEKEYLEKEHVYIKQRKKDKMKIVIGSFSGILVGSLITLIIL